MKWVEISGTRSTERFQFLQKQLADAGLPNQVEFLEANSSNFEDILIEAQKHFDQIRVGPPFGEIAVGHITHLTGLMVTLKSCDSFAKLNGTWWPRSFFYEGFLRELTSHAKTLELTASALLVGSGAAMRAVFAALLKIGYSKFKISDRFEERGLLLVQDLKKVYFNAEIEFIPPSGLTALPGVHSILVNGTPLVKTNDLLDDLYYFNFFRPKGVVIDLNLIPLRPPLLDEAEANGATTIHGYELAAQTDVLWAREVLGTNLDLEKYRAGLKETLEKVPFDLSDFKSS